MRFDFVTLQPKEGGNARYRSDSARDHAAAGFLSTFSSMQQLIDKLVEAGVLQKNENAK